MWPLGDSCPLIGTALSPKSSTWVDEPNGVRTCTRLDRQPVFGDMIAAFRGHARRSRSTGSS
ncbi:hypothetical protein [Kineococcus esterisolvens]|uniref:hypothetical protein n=1 Tax=unclassified Kineococcus TaxID=2621656 RepID=UPI003D7E217C